RSVSVNTMAEKDDGRSGRSPAGRRRFPQVTWTPSFRDRATPGVGAVLRALQQRKIPSQVVSAGGLLRAGEVTLEVLHPPENGPEGNENTRSLVLLVEHGGHRILLTGDLEGPGLARLLRLPPTPVDVLILFLKSKAMGRS